MGRHAPYSRERLLGSFFSKSVVSWHRFCEVLIFYVHVLGVLEGLSKWRLEKRFNVSGAKSVTKWCFSAESRVHRHQESSASMAVDSTSSWFDSYLSNVTHWDASFLHCEHTNEKMKICRSSYRWESVRATVLDVSEVMAILNVHCAAYM